MDWMRWLSVVLVVALLLTGSPGLVARAQQSQELEYSEAGILLEESAGPAYGVGAGVATAVAWPLRAVTCVSGAVLGFTVLAVTFGSQARTAMAIAEEGCGGTWIFTEDQMRGGTWEDVTSR